MICSHWARRKSAACCARCLARKMSHSRDCQAKCEVSGGGQATKTLSGRIPFRLSGNRNNRSRKRDRRRYVVKGDCRLRSVRVLIVQLKTGSTAAPSAAPRRLAGQQLAVGPDLVGFGSTSISGVASLSFIAALPMPPRVFSTARSLCAARARSRSVVQRGRGDEGDGGGVQRPAEARRTSGGNSTGCGVGIEALGSPICAVGDEPPISTISGFTPKKAGVQSTRSARLPASIEPMCVEMPCAIAGLIVYFAM